MHRSLQRFSDLTYILCDIVEKVLDLMASILEKAIDINNSVSLKSIDLKNLKIYHDSVSPLKVGKNVYEVTTHIGLRPAQEDRLVFIPEL